eukprot:151957-Pelagomonas_calceolata.AAC.1
MTCVAGHIRYVVLVLGELAVGAGPDLALGVHGKRRLTFNVASNLEAGEVLVAGAERCLLPPCPLN